MVGLAHRGGNLQHPGRHLAHFLAGRGFETVHGGLSHLGDPAKHGYTVLSGCEHRDGEAITRFAERFLRSRKPAKPFFLDVGFLETHRTEWVCHGFSQEMHAPKDGEGDPGYCAPPAPLPDAMETRRDWLDFRHSVERLDGFYSRVLRALEETGNAGDTLVLVTTDHGIAFPGMKCKLTQHGTGVLQIIRFPGGLGRALVTDALVSHLDFYPTVCELLGEPQPPWLEGHSLLPLVRGECDSVREALFAEVTFHAAFEPKRSVRTARWNYIRNFAGPHPEVMPNCDDGHSKRLLMKHGLAGRITPAEELYDLMFDPLERHNLAGAPECQAVQAELQGRLLRWMQETSDPLLEADPIGMPLPQRVNTWDQLHPAGGEAVSDWDPAQWAAVASPQGCPAARNERSPA